MLIATMSMTRRLRVPYEVFDVCRNLMADAQYTEYKLQVERLNSVVIIWRHESAGKA